MKQLLLMALAAILFTSCKKETPAAPIDNSVAKDYYSITSKSITKTGLIWYGKMSITITNDVKINSIVFKKVNNLTGLQTWDITPANGTYSKTFGEGSDVFNGDNPFSITINLKTGKSVTDMVYFY